MNDTILGMYTTSRTAEYPPILIINFSHNPNVLSQVQALRRTYRSPSTLPPDQQTDPTALSNALTTFLTRITNLSEQEWLQEITTSPLDDTDLHTPWRDLIYAHFEEIFAATYTYLLHTEGLEATGRFVSSSHQALPISFPENRGEVALDEVFERNVLLLPVWLGRSVRVRIVVGAWEVGGLDADAEVVFGDGCEEICWVKAGTRVRFFIDGMDGEGLAAVLVLGTLS